MIIKYESSERNVRSKVITAENESGKKSMRNETAVEDMSEEI